MKFEGHSTQVPEIEKGNGYRCEDAPKRPLLPLADHAYALHRLMREDGFFYSQPALGLASDWLILAAGVESVSIVTNGLDEQDVYCSNTFEEERGAAASAVATVLTRHLFVWGAVEQLMRPVLRGRQKAESSIKMLSRRVDGEGGQLVHHDCASRHLFSGLEASGFDDEFSAVARKARQFDSGLIGQATLAAYDVRNKLAHGAVPWPIDQSISTTRGVLVGKSACRVLLFTLQEMLCWLVPSDAEFIDWGIDEDEEQRRLIVEALPCAHLGR